MLVNSCTLTIPTDFLTSQVSMAVSIDTHTALVRFMVGLGRICVMGIGWSWEDMRRGLGYTRVKLKTLILTSISITSEIVKRF